MKVKWARQGQGRCPWGLAPGHRLASLQLTESSFYRKKRRKSSAVKEPRAPGGGPQEPFPHCVQVTALVWGDRARRVLTTGAWGGGFLTLAGPQQLLPERPSGLPSAEVPGVRGARKHFLCGPWLLCQESYRKKNKTKQNKTLHTLWGTWFDNWEKNFPQAQVAVTHSALLPKSSNYESRFERPRMSVSGMEKDPAPASSIAFLVEFISICSTSQQGEHGLYPISQGPATFSRLVLLLLDPEADEWSADRAEEVWREKCSCSVRVCKLLLEGGKWCGP